MNLFLLFRKSWFLLGPLSLSWMIFLGKEFQCIFTILVVSSFWVFEVLPLGITSLLPMLFFPVFNILSAPEVSRSYFQDSTALFMFSLIMALAVQQCGLHRRLALGLLKICGPRRKCVLLMLSFATAMMSFFLSDTASTALSLPIATAIIEALQPVRDNLTTSKSSSVETGFTDNSLLTDVRKTQESAEMETKEMKPEDRGFCKALLLVCAQSSMIGGTGIITGTAPNVMFRDQLKMIFPEKAELSYVAWMAFSVPAVPFYILSNCIVVVTVCIGFSSLLCLKAKNLTEKETTEKKEMNERMVKTINSQYKALGSISFSELSVIFWFVILLSAWISRAPGFIPGWGSLLGEKNGVSDSTVAVLITAILFIWPKNIGSVVPILEWKQMKEEFPWSVFFFVGSGSAISEAVKVSGLADYTSCVLGGYLHIFSPFWLQVVALTITLTIVEIAGNVPTAGVVIPIVLAICRSQGIDPLYIGLPCTLAVSYSFVLPHACASNTIVKETNLVSGLDFLLSGTILKVFCLGITLLNFNTYAHFVLDIQGATSANSTISTKC